jgi:hypothetical protein
VLLILSEETLARARVLTGKATIALKLPVSLQVVLRALLEEGLKQQHQPAVLANIEAQANAIREARRLVRSGGKRTGRRRA